MPTTSFKHLSAFIGSRKLGLGWLEGISLMENRRAVTTNWHTHSTTELLLCLRGETHYEFRRHEHVTLSAGSFLVIPANVEHRVSNAIDEPGKRLGLNLRHSFNNNRQFAVFEASDYLSFRQELEGRSLVQRTWTTDMKRAIPELERLLRIRKLSSAEVGYMRLLCCLILYAATQPSIPSTRPQAKIVDEAIAWLNIHFPEHISIDRLAAYMGYSKSRLFALFREYTGLAPNNYILRLRIRKAKELLISSNDSILNIAAATGFTDSRYFSRVFKQHTGNTPLDYRNQCQGGKG